MKPVNMSIALLADASGVQPSRRRILKGAALAAAGLAVGLGTPLTAWAADNGGDEGEHSDRTILKFSSLAGIHEPFLGEKALSQFRGVHGGGAPWVLSEGRGELDSDGHLKVRARGLVLDPAFVLAKNGGGTNPVPKFMAIVSGFSTDPLNPVNLATGLFDASTSGDSDIEADLTLPHPFFAPIVFVTSLPLGGFPRWFAVTGMQ